MLIGYLKK